MNFENLEQMRYEAVKATLDELVKIMQGDASPEVKINAAKVVDSISDTHVKAWLLSQEVGAVEKVGGKLAKQLDKLTEADEL